MECTTYPTTLPHVTRRTIITEDFNSHSTCWGYPNANAAGKEVQRFLNSNVVEVLFNQDDKRILIHYSGKSTNPDFASLIQLFTKTRKFVTDDEGSGYKVVITKK